MSSFANIIQNICILLENSKRIQIEKKMMQSTLWGRREVQAGSTSGLCTSSPPTSSQAQSPAKQGWTNEVILHALLLCGIGLACLVRWSWHETINDFLFHLGSYGKDTSPTWILVLSKLSRDLQADTKRASVPTMVCRAGQRSWERKWEEVTLAGSHLLPTRAPKSEIVQEILSDC